MSDITICHFTDKQIDYLINCIQMGISEGIASYDDEILKDILIELEYSLENFTFIKK